MGRGGLGASLALVVVALLALPSIPPVADASSLRAPSTLAVREAISLATDTIFSGSGPSGNPQAIDVAWDSYASRLFAIESDGLLASFSQAGVLLNESYLGPGLTSLVTDPIDGQVFVSQTSADVVFAVNGANDTLRARIPVGPGPMGLAFDAATLDVYVADNGSGNLTVVQPATDSVRGNLSAGAGAQWVAADAKNGQLFVSDSGACPAAKSACKMTIVDPSNGTIPKTLSFTSPETRLAFDNATGNMYVVYRNAGLLTAIHGANDSLLTTIGVNGSYLFDPTIGVAWDSSSNTVFASTENQYVVAVNGTTDKVIAQMFAPYDIPQQLAFAPVNGELFASLSNPYAPIDALDYFFTANYSYGGSFGTHHAPGAVTCCAHNGDLYVFDAFLDRIDLIDPSSGRIVSWLAGIGGGPLLADPSHNRLFESGSTHIDVYNGTTGALLEQISDSGGPGPLAWDPLDGRLYAGNQNGTVGVYDVAHNRTLRTIGLHVPRYGAGPVVDLSIDLVHHSLYAVATHVYDQYGDAVANISRISLQTGKVVASVPQNSLQDSVLADSLAVDSKDGELYVASTDLLYGGGEYVVAYNSTTLGRLGQVSIDPQGWGTLYLAWAPRTGAVVATASDSGKVYQILTSNNTVGGSVEIGSGPTQPIWVPSDASYWVANSQTGTLSVVTP